MVLPNSETNYPKGLKMELNDVRITVQNSVWNYVSDVNTESIWSSMWQFAQELVCESTRSSVQLRNQISKRIEDEIQ
jgi:hypothetical protein